MGAIATLVEWGTFYILAIVVGIYYQLGVIISLLFGAASNYLINKVYTFKNKSKKIASQFLLHIGVSIFSWIMHIGVMFVMVDMLSWEKMLSKILTTAIMLLPNYLMYKYTVFNPNFFNDSQ